MLPATVGHKFEASRLHCAWDWYMALLYGTAPVTSTKLAELGKGLVDHTGHASDPRRDAPQDSYQHAVYDQ